MMWLTTIGQMLLLVLSAPLLLGVVKIIKCFFQNRKGPSVLQPYRNLNKLFRKEVIVANTTSPLFRIAPYIIFSGTVISCAAVPLLIVNASNIVIADVIVLVGLFSLTRFFLALAGLDAGTAFGGMGSSRELMIAAIAEPALLMVLFTVAMTAASTNLDVIINYFSMNHLILRPSLIFAAMSLAIIAVTETGRIPIDNPATHLELTMIHEAMILEYSGRHLALIEWSAQIKFMLYAVLWVNLFSPVGIAHDFTLGAFGLSVLSLIGKLLILMVALGITEISLAKLRLFRVPYLLNLAFVLGLLAMLIHIILEVG